MESVHCFCFFPFSSTRLAVDKWNHRIYCACVFLMRILCCFCFACSPIFSWTDLPHYSPARSRYFGLYILWRNVKLQILRIAHSRHWRSDGGAILVAGGSGVRRLCDEMRRHACIGVHHIFLPHGIFARIFSRISSLLSSLVINSRI